MFTFLLGASLLLGGLGYQPVFSQSTARVSYNIENNRGEHRIRHSDGNQSFTMNYDGEIKFNEDFTDFSFISPGGYVTIAKTSFGNKRRLELKGFDGGEIRRQYYDGGKEKPYEPEGRKFLEEVLPDVLRTSRIGAEDRIQRMYAKGGIPAISEEMRQIDSDYTKAYYLMLALDLEGIKTSEQANLVKLAAETLDSDFELSRLLRNTSTNLLDSPETERAFLDAVASLDSDFEKSRLLKGMVEEINLADQRMVSIINGMDSDFEKSRILMSALEKDNLTETELTNALKLLETMDSDFEKARVMRTVLEKRVLGNEGIVQVLSRLNEIDSDFEKSRILRELIEGYDLGTKEVTMALDMLENLDSDFEKSRVLQALVEEDGFSDDSFEVMLLSIDDIDSDFEKSKLIMLMLNESAYSTGNLKRMIESIEKIDSDFERSKILKEAAQLDDLSSQNFLDLIAATSQLDSDYERSKVLIAIANEMPNEDKLKAAIREAARDLADHEYGRVMRSLDN